MRRYTWTNRFAESSSRVCDSISAHPLLELCGDRRILIEHHLGVSHFGTERIMVRVRYGEICIEGENLTFCRMTGFQLVITGQINGIKIIRR